MLLWVVMALMTGAAVMAVLWPLSRRISGAESEARGDVEFYRDQMAEIDREMERGLISADQAKAAKAEAGRRLLRAHAEGGPAISATGEPALRRRRAAAAFSLSIVPLIGLAVYGVLGSPQISSRIDAEAARAEVVRDFAGALAKIEAHLAANPEDGRGWDVIAPVYLGAGRYEDAARAYAAARRLQGESVDRLTGHGEALVGAAGGVVSAEAAAIFAEARRLDPTSAKARFYAALSAEQDGDAAQAMVEYRRMIAEAPAQAPWVPIVQARLGRLETREAKPVAGPQPASPEILAMVEGLDSRLARHGGTEPEWARLVRSFVVLGRPDEARDRLAKAKSALAADAQAVASLDRLGQDLGLPTREAGR
ncbi:c-type cytochrome biogenesis protein CcmI [Enterovirga aerilata]|uniref:C-type cytochrome biogenesis protein CcmI n=1 Tax=Enterovirga aerilata TaxID=2730920 RepID=A0A849I8L9_9HYPH|nr:c-type cytochrome biogenesis protein CcmI [Enterovirga sp. DB1703]NNM72635.1 c-type cytochrome biogenesis protein CcmI [Enterovirga sp. DB1703]